MQTYETNHPDETHALGRRLAEGLSAGDCLALTGDLGAGKTVFVRGLAEGLSCDVRLVSSPTYVLVQNYPGRWPLFHIDLYRLGDPTAEFADLGVEEMLESGVVVIEWADRAAAVLPHRRTNIRIDVTGETTRRFQVETLG
jgi:tRNA threonylcarbamoyladenosine biosynthesis protein TsaE